MSQILPKFGQYQTSRVLGEGAAGKVYLAQHPTLGWDLAIKVLTCQKDGSEAQRQRFRREVRTLAQLRHPGLVEVVDGGEEAGVPWFAMRLVTGGSLEELLAARGPLPPASVVALGIQLCEALGVAHASGILHRDLKPDNILCAGEGRYLIGDFGLARDANQESTRLSLAGQLLGTPGYWAPEQAIGDGFSATPATDVYGIGGVLYSALTGRPPIEGSTLTEIVIATQEQQPDPPSRWAPGTSPALDRLILRCLEKEPQARHQSLNALLNDLSELDPARAEAQSDGQAPRSQTLLLGILLAGLLAVAAVLAVLVFMLWNQRAPSTQTSESPPVAAVTPPEEPEPSSSPPTSSPPSSSGSSHAAELERERAAIAETLSELSQAKLTRAEAVLKLVALTGEESAHLVTTRLKEITAKMVRARREFYLSGIEPESDPDLVHALDSLARDPRKALNPRQRQAMDRAQRRLVEESLARARDHEIQGEGGQIGAVAESSHFDLLGSHLEAAIGRQELLVAQTLCETIGSFVKVAPGNPALWEPLVFYLHVEGDSRRAIPAGLALLRVGGEDGQRELLKLRIRFGTNSAFTRAIDKAWGKLGVQPELELESDDFQGYFKRGEARLAQGKTEAALADFEAALRLQPQSTTTLHNKALCLSALGDLEGAIRTYGRVLELQPEHYPALNNRGQLRKKLGDWVGALEDFQRGINRAPNELGFRVGRAQTLLAMGRVADALQDGDQAVKVAPTKPIAWHLRGVVRQRGRDHQGAVEDLTRSIELDTSNLIPRNFLFRAESYLNLNRPRESLRDLDRALREGSDSAGHCWYLRGVAHLRLGDPKAALTDFTKAVEIDPTNAAAIANRGALRVSEGDLQGAHEDISRALEIDSSQAQPWLNRAEVRTRLKDLEGALADANSCLEKATKPGVMPYLVRAQILIRLKRAPEARADLERFLRLAPKHPSAARAKSLLAELGE